MSREPLSLNPKPGAAQATDRALNAHGAVAVLRGAREHYYLCNNEARPAFITRPGLARGGGRMPTL